VNRSRIAAILAAGIAVLLSSLAAGTFNAPAQSAPPEPGGSPLKLAAPTEIHAYYYRGTASFDAGLRLAAPNGAFELWSRRPTYDDQIQMEMRFGGQTIELPEGLTDSFRSLPDFIKIQARDDAGNVWGRSSHDVCLNGFSERTHPDAPIRSPYPWGCPWNKFTQGSVQGIQDGWGTRLEVFGGMRIAPGTYQAKAFIPTVWRDLLGIAREDGIASFTLVVDDQFAGCRGCRESARPGPQPAAEEPTSSRAGAPGDVMPDLQSLPAFGIQITGRGNFLAFSANVWNAGDSPLVVDGFRDSTADPYMTAYQYFVDSSGHQTGYQEVGQLMWHDDDSHHHWHFTDFARYRLLNADLSEAVRSRKESFCLANTDAVDYTVPGADWQPESTDLHTACGSEDSLSIREVLSSGSGDTYAQWRAGQSFNLKGLPNGTYYIAVEANPDGNLVEHDTTNNVALRKVLIGGVPGARTVKVGKVGIL
jgi:hypothetical protein